MTHRVPSTPCNLNNADVQARVTKQGSEGYTITVAPAITWKTVTSEDGGDEVRYLCITGDDWLSPSFNTAWREDMESAKTCTSAEINGNPSDRTVRISTAANEERVFAFKGGSERPDFILADEMTDFEGNRLQPLVEWL